MAADGRLTGPATQPAATKPKPKAKAAAKAAAKPGPTSDTFGNSSTTSEQIAANYPGFGGLLQSNPEIAALLMEAAAGNWTPQELQAKLVGTDWWKSTSDTQRQWEYQKLVDPATATRQSNATALEVLQSAASQGVSVNLSQASSIADRALGEGWDQTRITQEVAKLARPGAGGTIGATQTSLRGIASEYGVNLSDATTFKWAKDISDGFADQKGFTEYTKNQAIIAHPYWQKELESGATVRQLADPYLQQASQLLEISPDAIDLSNPKWNITTQGKDGTRQPMSQSQWASQLMTSPQYGWDKTQNAKSAALNVVSSLRQSFGAS